MAMPQQAKRHVRIGLLNKLNLLQNQKNSKNSSNNALFYFLKNNHGNYRNINAKLSVYNVHFHICQHFREPSGATQTHS